VKRITQKTVSYMIELLHQRIMLSYLTNASMNCVWCSTFIYLCIQLCYCRLSTIRGWRWCWKRECWAGETDAWSEGIRYTLSVTGVCLSTARRHQQN